MPKAQKLPKDRPKPMMISLSLDAHKAIRVAAAYCNKPMKDFGHDAIVAAAEAKLRSLGIDPKALPGD